MREYILTEREREAIRHFLKSKESSGLVNVLRHRARQHLDSLKKDIELLEQLIG